MQSIHTIAYMVRDIYKGHYAKTNDDKGTGYVMFRTKVLAQEYIDKYHRDEAFVVKVRTATTPIDSGRDERALAIRKIKARADAQASQSPQPCLFV